MGIFLCVKRRRGDLAGGIIQGTVEGEAGSTAFEPVVMAGIELDEEPGLRHALATAAVAGRPSGPRTGDAGGDQEAMDGRAREDDPVVLGELLGEVLMVEPSVDRPGQASNPLLQGLGESVSGDPTPIPMGQGSRALPPERRQQPLTVPVREAQKCGGLGDREAAFIDGSQDHGTSLFFLCQGDLLPSHMTRVTESLFNYRTTLSLFIDNANL